MRVHPARETIAHHGEIRWAVPQDGGHHLHGVGASEDGLDAVGRMRDPPQTASDERMRPCRMRAIVAAAGAQSWLRALRAA